MGQGHGPDGTEHELEELSSLPLVHKSVREMERGEQKNVLVDPALVLRAAPRAGVNRKDD